MGAVDVLAAAVYAGSPSKSGGGQTLEEFERQQA